MAEAASVTDAARFTDPTRVYLGFQPATYVVTWLRNGQAGHTGTTYRLRAGDGGQRIQVKVTAQTPGYESRSATSRAVQVHR